MPQPNIIFFLIDDLGCRDLSCFGSSFYETPNLDRLAREGMKFTNAYASCPVCSPTRASCMSGKYPARVGITQFIGGHNNGKLLDVPYLHYLPLEEKSVASALKDGGYQTWHIGKWHLGDDEFHPENHGFDVNVAGCHWGHPKKGFFAPWEMPNLEEAEDGTYLTDHLTDKALDLIKDRDPGKPFFMNFCHYAVHTPIQAPEELVEKYRQKAKRLHLDEKDPFVFGEYFPHHEKPKNRVKRRIIQSNPVYAAMVENMDTNIGRVMDLLDELELTNDTLVVFTSDNGGLATSEGSPTCNLPYSEGKGWMHEGGNRVCQIMRWPAKIAADSVCHENVISTDFYPTFLDAAGLDQLPEQHCDGESLHGLITQEQKQLDREAIFWHYPHYSNQGDSPSAAVLADNWKLIKHFEDDRLELYDLANDPSETINLADDCPEKTTALHQLLTDWQKDVEAKIPADNPDWNPVVPQVDNNAHI